MKIERVRASSVGNGIVARLSSIGVSATSLSLLAVLAILPSFIKDESILRLILTSLLLGSQAMVYDFTEGLINICNFGFAGFVGLGAYTSALLAIRLGVSPWIGLIAGTVAAGMLGFFAGILILPLRGIYAACMTWFLALGLMAVTSAWVDLTRGYRGLSVPFLLETVSIRPYFYILLLITVMLYVVLRVVANSHIGLAFRAIGQNLQAARAAGVNPTKYKVINFTLSCAFAGLLGGFYAHFIGILTPAVMDTKHTMEVLTLSYVGGRGTLWGGVAVAFLLIPVFEYLRPLLEIRLIIYGVLLILVMVLYPEGFAGICRRIAKRIVDSLSDGEKAP